jgi:hypothetical protein
METSTKEGIHYGLVTSIRMITLTRTSLQDSARINYFLIKNSYIHRGRYSASDKNSLSYKCNKEIDIPVIEDGEFYWMNKTVPMINKKYCKIRANIDSSIKVEYFGEYYVDLFPESNAIN